MKGRNTLVTIAGLLGVDAGLKALARLYEVVRKVNDLLDRRRERTDALGGKLAVFVCEIGEPFVNMLSLKDDILERSELDLVMRISNLEIWKAYYYAREGPQHRGRV